MTARVAVHCHCTHHYLPFLDLCPLHAHAYHHRSASFLVSIIRCVPPSSCCKELLQCIYSLVKFQFWINRPNIRSGNINTEVGVGCGGGKGC